MRKLGVEVPDCAATVKAGILRGKVKSTPITKLRFKVVVKYSSIAAMQERNYFFCQTQYTV